MKIYEFTYPGLWLGGHIMLCAETKERAFELFKEALAEKHICERMEQPYRGGPKTDILTTPEEWDPGVFEIKEGIFYDYNGDY